MIAGQAVFDNFTIQYVSAGGSLCRESLAGFCLFSLSLVLLA